MCISKLNNVDKICKNEYNLIVSTLHVSDIQKYLFSLSFYERKHTLHKNGKLVRNFNFINKSEENFETSHLQNLTNKEIPKDIAVTLNLGPKFAPININKLCQELKIVSEVANIFTTYSDKSLIKEDKTMIARTINNYLNSNSLFSPTENFMLSKKQNNFLKIIQTL